MKSSIVDVRLDSKYACGNIRLLLLCKKNFRLKKYEFLVFNRRSIRKKNQEHDAKVLIILEDF